MAEFDKNQNEEIEDLGDIIYTLTVKYKLKFIVTVGVKRVILIFSFKQMIANPEILVKKQIFICC